MYICGKEIIMNKNPFIITDKVIPEYFCDREKESAELVKLLENGNNVVLLSQRRIGKTALIQYCYQQPRIKQEFITVYVDILSTNNLQDFIYILGREIFDTIKTKGQRMWKSFVSIVKSLSGKLGIDPMTGFPTLNLQLGDIIEPNYSLKEIFQYLEASGKPCILAIDEFQQISNYPEKNVEALIRSHILQINGCRMIFSGSERHVLSEMFTVRSRPFYQSSSLMELSEIPEEKYVEFIIRMFASGQKLIEESLARKIYELNDGITFYIQRICNGVYSNTEKDKIATEDILYDTLDGILASYDVIFRLKLSHMSTRQKELLFAIAKEGYAQSITSVEFINKYALASASAVQTSVKSLIKSETVVRTEKGYVIDDRFFRLWLVKNFV